MKRYVDTYNTIEGYHFYPDAPEFCNYLSNRHRHIFVIKCQFAVNHNEREIEINNQQHKIDEYLRKKYGPVCEFGPMSCESIAEEILTQFNAEKVTVLEDNYGGATLSK